MIGIDTNILLRFILQDDPIQSPRAARLFESLTIEDPAFVSIVTVAELYGVLDHKYRYTSRQIASVLETLLRSQTVLLENERLVAHALNLYQDRGGDFDDYLVAQTASSAGCDRVFTFDRTAAKSGIMQLLS